MCIYIYIYIERERERERCISYRDLTTHTHISLSLYIYIYTQLYYVIHDVAYPMYTYDDLVFPGRRVKDHHDSLRSSPLSKKSCVRQVVLDKWFPPKCSSLLNYCSSSVELLVACISFYLSVNENWP